MRFVIWHPIPYAPIGSDYIGQESLSELLGDIALQIDPALAEKSRCAS
jgi:hypothetical protein